MRDGVESETDVVEEKVHDQSQWWTGFLQKAILVTLPMWVTVIMVFTQDVRPDSKIHGHTSFPVHGNLSSQEHWFEEEVRRAHEEVEKSRQREREMQAMLKDSAGPVGHVIDESPRQGGIAVLAVLLGVLGIAGPTAAVRFVYACIGSLTCGLMVASAAGLCTHSSGSELWLDAVASVASGKGTFLEYALWLSLFSMGMLRWFFGWEFALYDEVDDLELGEGGAFMVLNRPLLVSTEPDKA